MKGKRKEEGRRARRKERDRNEIKRIVREGIVEWERRKMMT